MSAAARRLPEMTALRRQLHETPEVGLHLPATQAIVRAELEALGLEVESDDASSGLSAVIPGSGPSTVVLRADMDALPIQEPATFDFRSRNAGAMHACGHDLHTSMLVAAAREMVERQPTQTVVLAFQAGEEFDRGALPLLEHRNLASVGSARTFAVHVHAMLPTSTLHSRAGAFMGFGDWFTVTVQGAGGHASAPHLARSPIGPAAWIARRIDELTGLRKKPWPVRVATVTMLDAGSSVNVIPDTALVRGTLRAGRERDIEALRETLATIAREADRKFGTMTRAEVEIGYPAVVNDAAALEDALERATALGIPTFPMQAPSMVIEDFSYFTARWPGAMLYLGAAVDGATAFNHSADVAFDEQAMVAGCAFHLAAAYA